MKRNVLMVIVGLALISGPAMADSLTVNATAAMNGTNYGLEVAHDNSSVAYVQDDTPAGESIYRFSYLFDPNSVAGTGSGDWTMTLFGAMGPNPRPNNGANPCPLNANIPVFPMRVTLIATGAGSSTPVVRATMMSNICGVVGASAFVLSPSGPAKICGYFIQGVGPVPGPQSPGEVGIAVVGTGDACPSDGDPSYKTVSTNNDEHNVTLARMGSLGTNGFGAGENGSVYYDEFESFRTLAP